MDRHPQPLAQAGDGCPRPPGRGRGRRVALFRVLAEYRSLFPGERARDLRGLSIAEMQAHIKWARRARGAQLIELALASGWVHLNDRGRKDLMAQFEAMARGESQPEVPAAPTAGRALGLR